MDEGDRGQEAADHYLAVDLANQRNKTLTAESNMYCEACGERIPDKRREAMPGCTMCVFCADLHERGRL